MMPPELGPPAWLAPPPDPTTGVLALAEMLAGFTTARSALLQRSVSPAEACLALLEELEHQLEQLGPVLDAGLEPYLAWLEGQTSPILGPARERHARWAELARAGIEFSRAQRELSGRHRRVLKTALQRCRVALLEVTAPPVTSVHALLALWTGIADAAFREQACSEGYGAAFAALVNSGSRLRSAWLKLNEAGPGAGPVAGSRAGR